jgi:hypothetical protein
VAASSQLLESDPEAGSPLWGVHPWVAEVCNQIRFGVAQLVWSSPPDWIARRDFAQQAADLGFDSVWARITRR